MRFLLAAILVLAIPLETLADCSGGATPTGKPCGSIDFAGCCESGKLLYCEGGELCELPCNTIPQCGWNADKGYYDCETEGMADPDLLYPKVCPVQSGGACQGVDYAGCCAGTTVYWCDGKQLHGFDCAGNTTHSTCGTNAAVSVADCVEPGAAEFKSCPFEAGSVELPDQPAGDVVSGDSAGIEDIGLSTDGLTVPDIAAPSTCSELAARYTVDTSTCDMLGGTFLTLQDGCAALMVGLAPDAVGHATAKVTKTGLAFWFSQEGLEYNCTASFSGDSLSGQCFWGNGGECTFAYGKVVVEEPVVEEKKEPKDGGCSMGGKGTWSALGLLLALGLCLRRARRVAN